MLVEQECNCDFYLFCDFYYILTSNTVYFADPKPPAKSRRNKNFVQTVKGKPRGLVNGPKRTPPTIGDQWQNQQEYEVEEVIRFLPSLFYLCDF